MRLVSDGHHEWDIYRKESALYWGGTYIVSVAAHVQLDIVHVAVHVQLEYRPYAIPHVTKRKTDSGRKSGYYAAILSGMEDHGIWHLSTTKHFVSSQYQRSVQVCLFASVSVRSC